MRKLYSAAIVIAVLLSSIVSSAQVVINEFLASNQTVAADPDNLDYVDWIELYNPASLEIDLSGYLLADGTDTYEIPAGTIIPGTGYLLFWADNTDVGNHTNFKLSASGENISLSDPIGNIIDAINYSDQTADISFGRVPDGAETWGLILNPTPHAANASNTIEGRAPKPRFSVPGGFFSTAVDVSISSTIAGAEIRYTVDGSEPTASSELYAGPITVDLKSGATQKSVISDDYYGDRDLATVIRAKLFHPNYAPSYTATNTYFVGLEKSDLPVVAVSTDMGNLWDESSGIYVDGDGGTPNYNEDWERPMSFEFFDESGTQQVSQDVGASIMGAFSRTFHQKSFSFTARSEYGKDRINYKFFKNRDYSEFKNIVIRNSGNEGDGGTQGTMLRDAFMQYMVKDKMDVDYQEYQPVAVYLNGEYWGLYNLREKLNKHYVANSHPEVSVDDVDFLKNNFEEIEVLNGDSVDYYNLLNYLETADLSLATNYDYVAEQVDINSYIDYMIAEIFVSNADWPGNNIRLWREHDGGKWRWIFYDTDFGFGLWTGRDASENMIAACLDPNGTFAPPFPQNPPRATVLFRRLMENEAFKNEFVSRFNSHLNTTFSQERIVPIMEAMKAAISSEIPKHYDEWKHKFTGYDADAWNDDCNAMLNFGEERIGYIRDQLEDQFGLTLSGNTLTTLISGGGSVYIDGVETQSTATGIYFDGFDVSLKAEALPGYEFLNWQEVDISSSTEELVPFESEWKYSVLGMDLGTGWKKKAFNDVNWPSGAARLGYGDSFVVTELDNTSAEPTYYFRKTFTLANNPNEYSDITLGIIRDDGAVIYINGTEVARTNLAEGTISYDDLALSSVNDAAETQVFNFTIPASVLVEGENLIAVEVHQQSLTSTDLGFDCSLTAVHTQTNGTVYSSDAEIAVQLGTDLALTAVFQQTDLIPDVIINEVMASNKGTLADEAGEFDDWIELYNPHDVAVDVGGLFLSDIADNLRYWQIPDSVPSVTTIPAGGFLIIWADNDPEQGPLHATFKLSATAERIVLNQALGTENIIMDEVSLLNQQPDLSYGLLTPDAVSNTYLLPTPGTANKAIPSFAGLKVNEFMAKNNASVLDEFGEADDWIEIVNTTDRTIDIGGLYISDTLGEPGKWRVPTGHPELTTIEPGGYLLIWTDNDTEQGVLHADFSLSASGGDVVLSQISKNGFVTISSFSYLEQKSDLSFGRYPDGGTNLQTFAHATPEAQNVLLSFDPVDNVFINEICPNNNESAFDEHGNNDDWIELYNANTDPINVGGLFISDNPAEPMKWKIPALYPDSTTIPAGGYLLFWPDSEPDEGIAHLGFKLGTDEAVGLYQVNAGVLTTVDEVDYITSVVDVPYGRFPDGSDDFAFLQFTPESQNEKLDSLSVSIMVRTVNDTVEMLLHKGKLVYEAELRKNTTTIPIVEGNAWYPGVTVEVVQQPDSYTKGVAVVRVVSATDSIDYVVNISKKLYSNAKLSSLNCPQGVMSPAFNPEIYNYRVSLDGNTSAIPELSYVTENVFAKASIYLPVSVPGEAKIIVYAEDGSFVNYFVRFSIANTQLVKSGDVWKYNDSGVLPVGDWTATGYDDATWAEDTAVFGYGEDDIVTEISYGADESDKILAYFFRKSLHLSEQEKYTSLHIDIRRDDGAIIFLNGTPVVYSNMEEGAVPAMDLLASSKTESADEQAYFSYDLPADSLKPGLNTIAVSLHQDSESSSDLSFDAVVSGTKELQLSEETQTLNFKKGWNLFSFNVYTNDMTPLNIFTGNLHNVDIIKDFEAFYQPNNLLSSLKIVPGRGYLLKAVRDFSIDVSGLPLTGLQTVGVDEGWNIIGVPANTVQQVDAVFLKTLPSLLQLKNEESRYVNGQAPYLNSLQEMVPGEGYLLKMKKGAILEFGNN